MPTKKIASCGEDDRSQTAIAWFSITAAILSDTDITDILEHENIYCADDLAYSGKMKMGFSHKKRAEAL